jgi:predicted NUDIX family NTP pyrophosphohydrolase
MPITSAGILLFRGRSPRAEVFLVHPGGPFWATKDEGAWSVPKGIVEPDEEHLVCARREFREETGFDAVGSGHDLGVFRQASGKHLHVWAIEGDCDPSKLKSNTFEIEWPPRSNRLRSFPEVDRGGWFGKPEALHKILKGQRPIIETFFAQI